MIIEAIQATAATHDAMRDIISFSSWLNFVGAVVAVGVGGFAGVVAAGATGLGAEGVTGAGGLGGGGGPGFTAGGGGPTGAVALAAVTAEGAGAEGAAETGGEGLPESGEGGSVDVDFLIGIVVRGSAVGPVRGGKVIRAVSFLGADAASTGVGA